MVFSNHDRVSKIIDVCARLHNLCVDSWLTKKFGADQSIVEETPYPYPRPRLPEVPESYVSQYRSRNVAQTMDEEKAKLDALCELSLRDVRNRRLWIHSQFFFETVH